MRAPLALVALFAALGCSSDPISTTHPPERSPVAELAEFSGGWCSVYQFTDPQGRVYYFAKCPDGGLVELRGRVGVAE